MGKEESIKKETNNILKDVHLASKDICKILHKESGMWSFITYPIWFVILFVMALFSKKHNSTSKNKNVC
jgi:hypothetical protein